MPVQPGLRGSKQGPDLVLFPSGAGVRPQWLSGGGRAGGEGVDAGQITAGDPFRMWWRRWWGGGEGEEGKQGNRLAGSSPKSFCQVGGGLGEEQCQS